MFIFEILKCAFSYPRRLLLWKFCKKRWKGKFLVYGAVDMFPEYQQIELMYLNKMLSVVYNELYPVVKWSEMREEIYMDIHKKISTVKDSSHLAQLFTSQIRRYCWLSCQASITSPPVRMNFSNFRNGHSEDYRNYVEISITSLFSIGFKGHSRNQLTFVIFLICFASETHFC